MSRTTKLGLALGACCAVASLAWAGPSRPFAGRPLPFEQSTGRIVAFYLDGGAIASGYRPDPVTAGNLTHLLYAFLAICGPGQTAHAARTCAPGQDFQLAAPGRSTMPRSTVISPGSRPGPRT